MLSQPKQKRVKVGDIVTLTYDEGTLYEVYGHNRTGLKVKLNRFFKPNVAVTLHKRSSVNVLVVREFL